MGIATWTGFGLLMRPVAQLPMFLASIGTAIMECQDNLQFMHGLPDACMQLIVTSSPYNMGKSYERRTSLNEYMEQQRAVSA